MNTIQSKEISNYNSPKYKKLLASGALGTIVAGKATRILDAANLKEGSFVRCEVSTVKPTGYGREITWVDIPEINLQKAIKFGKSGTSTRAIVADGSVVGGNKTVRVESYNPRTHELHVIGQHSGRFTLKVPVSYTTLNTADTYYHDHGTTMKTNPTQPQYESVLPALQAFIAKTTNR